MWRLQALFTRVPLVRRSGARQPVLQFCLHVWLVYLEMDPSYDSHASTAPLLYELSELIDRGDEKGVADFLASQSDLETVFLPFPPVQVTQKVLLPSVFYAVKKSTSHDLSHSPL